MKISVLISVYYKEKPEYLQEALESILNQTYMPSQIVIIKDGEVTQELENVLNIYKEKFYNLIDIYKLEEHLGLGEALKFGVNKCKYEYIARMDSDDMAVKDRFEKQVEYLKENPQVDILGGYIEEYDEELKKLIDIRKIPLSNKEIRKKLKIISPFNHGTVIFKKQKVLEAGNYNNCIMEDYDLWARMILKNAQTANLAKVLIKSRTGKTMYRKRSTKKYIQGIYQIERNLLNYKIINKVEYFYNVITRILIAKTPISMKIWIYPHIIRKIN